MNKLMATMALVAGSAIAAPMTASAATAAADSIPFVRYGGIQSWTAKDENTLYVQSANRQWYEVDLAGPCLGLPFAVRLGVATGPTDTLDNFSSIIVDGERCPVQSVKPMAAAPQLGGGKH